MLLQPARDRVGVAPFVLRVAVDFGYLDGAEFFFDILLVQPVSVLIERFMT